MIRIKRLCSFLLIHSAFLLLPFNLNVEDHIEVVQPQVEMTENSLVLNLPTVRIKPNSPIYDLKRSWEEVRLFFSNTPQQKIELLLQMANSRLAEATTLLQDQNPEAVTKVLEDYTATMNKVEELQQDSTTSGTSINTQIHATKHKESLLQFITGEYQVQWQR